MYVKLFSSLYQGTLRGRADEILVFTNLLAHADQHGIVDKHWKAIAEETGLSRSRVAAAIKHLEAPDPESRSPEMNGCRITQIDGHREWGWQIVNYGKYRAIRSEDDRREQNRAAQERYRERHKSATVSHGQPRSAQGEGEGEEVKARAGTRGTRLPPNWTPTQDLKTFAATKRPDLDLSDTVERFKDYWSAQPGSKGVKLDWPATFRNWVRNEKLKPGARQPTSERPYKICSACNKKTFTWTSGKCEGCWRASQGLK